MDPHEIISALKANADQQDRLSKDLVASLAERHAATEDLMRITLHHLQLRTERSSMLIEAVFTAGDVNAGRVDKIFQQLIGMPA